jgi:hypothetical protein
VAVELTANWAPLERLLTPVQCAEFMWMYREDGVEHYKTHRQPQVSASGSRWAMSGPDGGRIEGGAF